MRRVAPPRSRRRRVAGAVAALVVLSVAAGTLLVAVRTNVLLARMTADVSSAQQRATSLANAQRQALVMLQRVTAVETGGATTDVLLYRGLLVRQLRIAEEMYTGDSVSRRELVEMRTAVDAFRWELLGAGGNGAVLRVSAHALISYVDFHVKEIYSEEEGYFYRISLDSLRIKQQSQQALGALVLLVVLLAVGLVLALNRRNRSDLDRANALLRHQAFHDALTGLPNRSLVMERLRRYTASGGTVTAVLVDLDGFKNVNDTLGHPGGDELLRRVADRLLGCVLERDTVGRLGGDEFAIVLPGRTAEQGAAVARRALAALRRPIGIAGQETRIGASIGVAQHDGRSGADELLADADIAMYAAKRAGKGRVSLFEQEMRERALQRSRLEQQLGRAVGLGQIEVHYQPIVDLADRRVVAVEALARWRLENGELMQPGLFIPIAEESGLICEIGAEVLRRACRTVRAWRAAVPGAAGLGVTVNVSGWQLLSPDYSRLVAGCLEETGLPAEALTLEITESVLLEDSDQLTEELNRLRRLGVRLAMDDFGAGYSSLSSLHRFPVDTLKIDRMFLDLGAGNPAPLVRAVAELGRSLGLTVVAEGVETVEQLAIVRAARCDAVQGFLVSRPLPEADARLFLEWAADTAEISALMSRSAVPSG